MREPDYPVLDPHKLSVSAASLAASHAMSEAVWKAYFPELPAKRPQLRIVLIRLHELALSGQAPNLSAARAMVSALFEVELNTAKTWIQQLEDFGLLKRLRGVRRNAFQLVPSATAKIALFRAGQDYLLYLRHACHHLCGPAPAKDGHVDALDWMHEIRALLEIEARDYKTEDQYGEGVR